MTIEHVDTVSGASEGAKDGSHVHPFTVTSAAEILIGSFGVGQNNPDGPTTVGAIEWRPDGAANQSCTKLWEEVNEMRVGMFALLNPTADTGDIVIARGHSTSVNWASHVWTIKGAKIELPGASQKDSGTSRSQSTVSGALGRLYDTGMNGGFVTENPDAGQTLLKQTSVNASGHDAVEIHSSYKDAAGGTMGWDVTFNAHGAVLFEELPSGGNQAIMAFSKAWDRWRERADGLLAPRGFNEPIWQPEPQVLTPTKAQVKALTA